LRREIEQSLQHLTEDAEEDEDAGYIVGGLDGCIRTPNGTISKFFNLKPLEGNEAAPANGT